MIIVLNNGVILIIIKSPRFLLRWLAPIRVSGPGGWRVSGAGAGGRGRQSGGGDIGGRHGRIVGGRRKETFRMHVSSSYDKHVSSSSSELCFRGTELWSHRHDFQLKDQLLSMPLFTYRCRCMCMSPGHRTPPRPPRPPSLASLASLTLPGFL